MPHPSTTPHVDDIPTRLQSGDESALRDLLSHFGGAVFAGLKTRYSHVFGNADLEDILSIAIHRIWKARDSIDPTRPSLLPWFRRIADNVAADILRHGWQKARLLELPDLHDARPEPTAQAPVSPPTPRTIALREIVAGGLVPSSRGGTLVSLPRLQRPPHWHDLLTHAPAFRPTPADALTVAAYTGKLPHRTNPKTSILQPVPSSTARGRHFPPPLC